MGDSTISAMPPAPLPLSIEAVPCVYDGMNMQAPAAAFGIPMAGVSPPTPLAQFQTWIDESTEPPTLRMYVGSDWVALYAFDSDGTLTLARPLALANGDSLAAALELKGVVDCSADPNYPAADQGDFYVVGVAGKIGGASGVDVDAGDTLLCLVDGSAAGDQTAVGANWNIAQGNIDGAVTGPGSSGDGNFATFHGTTGKTIADSGLSFDTDAALAANSDSRVASQKAVKSYVAGNMASLDGALIYRGTIGCAVNPNYPAADQGDVYVVSAAGKIGGAFGINVETGDTLLCRVDGTASGTQAGVGANWTIGQGNIDGAVTGPASASDGNFALFNGATGKIVKDGNLALDTDAAFAANSDGHIPSQKAVKSYVAANVAGALIYKGVISCSANPNYPAANQGDYYVVSTAGKIGGASGINVEIGDTLLCRVNSSVSGSQIVAGANWTVGQGNIDGAVTGPASASDGNFALFNGTTGKIVKDNSLSLDTDATLAANNDSRIASQKAVKSYVASNMASLAGAMIYRGVIDCSANPNYPAANQGDCYVVSVAGKIGGASGLNVEIGDTLLCRVNGAASGTQAGVGANWTIGQGNIDGAVTGPASASDGNFALFNGVTGKIVKDGNLALDTNTSLTANSDTHVPSQKAVKSYVDAVNAALGSFETSMLGVLIYRGLISCSANPNYPAANQGDYYVVSTPGKIGGASGLNVEVGDTLLCRVNSSGSGTQAVVGPNWTVGQGNIDGAVTGPASAADGNFALFNGTTGKIVKDNSISLDTDATLTTNSDSRIASQKAVKSYVASSMAGVLVYRGVIDCSANPNYPAANQGDYYVVSVAGKIGGTLGVNVEIGDTLLCRVNGSASGTQLAVGANWTVGQGNIDGAVTGPASASDGNFALFNGTSGKTVKDGSLSLDTDAALTANSDSRIASQKAVKSYIAGNPSGALIYKGVIDCSAFPNYPAANLGDYYVVSVAGKIGSIIGGIAVEAGDTLLCRVNGTASGTQAAVGANWTVGQGNIDGAVTGPASAVSSNFALFNGTTGKIIRDSGAFLDTDATMAANSDGRIPSQKAVKSSIGGQPLSADTLGQGQGWFWDSISSTFKARDIEGRNLLVNSAFDVWQDNVSYTFGGTAPKVHIADFWKVAAATSASYSVSRPAGLANAQYALKIQRNMGQTNTARVRLAQQFGQAETMYLAGKTVTVSFDFMVGANYSPTSGPVVAIFYGTGVDEDIDLHAGTPGFATGGGNVATAGLQSQIAAAGTVARIVAPPLAIPAGITEMILEIHTSVYVGTAGADDSFTIGNVKMEIGNIATPYRKPDFADELRRCQRRYQKSFQWATWPGAAGTMTGETRWRRFGAGTANEGQRVPLYSTMRTFPTLVLYNPSAANAQVRNETGGADCSATTVQNVSDSAFEITCTGNGGGAAGDWLGIHWVADARL